MRYGVLYFYYRVNYNQFNKTKRKFYKSLMITVFYSSNINSIIPDLKCQPSKAIGKFFYLND